MADTKVETRQPTVESLTAENTRLDAENKELKQQLADATGALAEQAEQLSNAEAAGAETVVVTHDKKQYRVIGKTYQLKGKPEQFKVADLPKNKEHVAEMVKAKSGLLQLIEKN